MGLRVAHFLAVALMLASSLAWSAPATAPMSDEATALIRQVHAASKRRDLMALKALMDDEFISSFGGDGGIDEAIADWKKYPVKLGQLSRVTGMRCEVIADVVQCPRGAGAGYRAGFKQTKTGWRMVYFVAGD